MKFFRNTALAAGPLLASSYHRDDRGHAAFCRARQRANRAFAAWLATDHPNPADVIEELEGTVNAMRQLAAESRSV